jgi:hypothetical protein
VSGLQEIMGDFQPGTVERLQDALLRLSEEKERLRHGLVLILRESEQFPDQDGIGAGTMARNLLAGAGR